MSAIEDNNKRIIRTQGLLSFQDPPRFRKGNLLIQDGQISAIGGIAGHNDAVIAESPYLIMPAFFQLRTELRESFLDRYFVATPPHEYFRHVQIPETLSQFTVEENNISVSTALQQMSVCGTSCASYTFSTLDEIKRIVNLVSNQRFRSFLLLDLETCETKSISELVEQVKALQTEHPDTFELGLYCRFPRKKLSFNIKKAALLSYENNFPLYVETPDLTLRCIQNLLNKIDLRSKNISLLPLTLTGVESTEVARLLAEEKIFVHITPLFHMLMGETPPNLEAFVEADVQLAVSSLSGATRSQYNIFHELYHLRRWLSPHCDDAAVRALRMATLNPATSAGFSAGKLGLDQCADLIALDIRNTKSTDVNHLADLIIDGGESQVRSLWVRGDPIIIPRTANHRTVRANTSVLTSLRSKVKFPANNASKWVLRSQLQVKRLFQRLLTS